MTDVKRMRAVLLRMAALLRRSGHGGWAEALDQRRGELSRDALAAAAAIRSWYGGTGGLDRVALDRPDAEFEALRDELLFMCAPFPIDAPIPPLRRVEGTVMRLHCGRCAADFPGFAFADQAEPEADGLACAASREADELVLAEPEPEEQIAWQAGGDLRFARRLAAEYGRPDLRVQRRRERPADGRAGGVSLRRARPAAGASVFACVRCDGESRVVGELSVEEFEAAGGRVHTVGGLYR
ncbi:hypothetical protein [Caulobacter sp. 17J80-11]|uniref:hypothetical protein n=1 Tax=Caulobacter sp. 17J80-11 TaxID=2763502 RepID=UPI0016537DCC|nr:hypothetical protein [Caulobacter sp. 17J80-11]MBC6981298.1 hypothetical protein [Caulobacter sp. 17J80-11]